MTWPNQTSMTAKTRRLWLIHLQSCGSRHRWLSCKAAVAALQRQADRHHNECHYHYCMIPALIFCQLTFGALLGLFVWFFVIEANLKWLISQVKMHLQMIIDIKSLDQNEPVWFFLQDTFHFIWNINGCFLTRSALEGDLSFCFLSCWYISKTNPWSQWWGSASSWNNSRKISLNPWFPTPVWHHRFE